MTFLKLLWTVVCVAVMSPCLSSSYLYGQATSSASVNVNPAGTYLFFDSACFQDQAASATSVTLSSLGITPGMLIKLTRVGAFQASGTFNDDQTTLGAVFRGPAGFISPGPNGEHISFNSLPTACSNISTDIVQDFNVAPQTTVEVPVGATEILFTGNDSFWIDNTDPNNDFGVLLIASAPITLLQTNHFCDDRSPNSVGLAIGRRLTFTADFTPDGDLNNDGFADSDGISPPSTAVASQDGRVLSLNFLPTFAEPSHFARSVPFDCDNPSSPDLRDAWTINISNGIDTLVTETPNVQGVPHVKFVRSMWLTGTGVTPTFNWTYEPNSNHDRVTISIRDLTNFIGQGGIGSGGIAEEIFAQNLSSTDTSFIMPPGILKGNPPQLYSVSIQLDTRRGPQPFPFARLQSRSRSFFDFSTEPLPIAQSAPVFLPIVDPTGSLSGGPVYIFKADVTVGQTIFIDPAVALGYDYQIGAGNPNFDSVLLPEVGDNVFDIYLWNGSKYVFHASVGAGFEYKFPLGGVDRFRVLGIESSAGVDPNNATAFVTGLKFVSSGQFTGTMTPIIAEAFCASLGDDLKPSLLDQDIYTLQGTRSEQVRVGLEKAGNNSSGDNATLMLVDNIPRAHLLRIDNSNLPNTVDAVLPATGEYLAIVAEQPLIARGNRYQGPYCITVQSSGNAAGTLQPTGWVE